MKTSRKSRNCIEIEIGRWRLLVSYEIVAAVWDSEKRRGYVLKSDLSTTTKRHASAWFRSLGEKDPVIKSPDWFGRFRLGRVTHENSRAPARDGKVTITENQAPLNLKPDAVEPDAVEDAMALSEEL